MHSSKTKLLGEGRHFQRLPLAVDLDGLRRDVAHCLQRQWEPHFNSRDYDGDWHTISLRNSSGEESNVFAHPDADSYKDTPLMAECPSICATLASIGCEKEAVRLMRQAPGGLIKTHRDVGLGYAEGTFRLHIPIHTHAMVDFVVAGTRLPMQAGECWYANFSEPHSVRNGGDTERIHLVIDCVRNAWSDDWLRAAGFDVNYLKPQPMPPAARQAMIAELKRQNSPAVSAILAELEAAEVAHMAQARLDCCLAFLDEIGIPWRFGLVPEDTFLPGLLVEQGSLIIDQEKLRYPGDILHEAGHIALLPPVKRPLFGGDLKLQYPEHEGDELAVILWTLAAARHLDLPLDYVVHDHGYHGQADWLREEFEAGSYIGLPLLVWMGLCEAKGPQAYPHMQGWIRTRD